MTRRTTEKQLGTMQRRILDVLYDHREKKALCARMIKRMSDTMPGEHIVFGGNLVTRAHTLVARELVRCVPGDDPLFGARYFFEITTAGIWDVVNYRRTPPVTPEVTTPEPETPEAFYNAADEQNRAAQREANEAAARTPIGRPFGHRELLECVDGKYTRLAFYLGTVGTDAGDTYVIGEHDQGLVYAYPIIQVKSAERSTS